MGARHPFRPLRKHPLFECRRRAESFRNYFQAVPYVTFTLLRKFVQVELRTAHGRIDVVVETEGWVWVMELKRDGTVAEALEHMEERGYCDRFVADPRTLIRIGGVFDSASRHLVGWKRA